MTAETPATRREIRARLSEIAPYPEHDTPDQASAVAKYLAVAAQRHWKWNLDIADMDGAEYWQSTQTMLAEFAALHLLMHLRKTSPDVAELAAAQIRDAWDDGGGIGEWLWEHAKALGIDTDEVGRLEEAWWAASPTATGETP
jgi:hypothetical protein